MADFRSTAYDPRFDARYAPREESLTGPIIVHICYLLTIPTFTLSAVAGLILAYSMKGEAGPAARSHYIAAIRTFWRTLWLMVLGVVLIVMGVPLSLVLVGIPLIFLGGALVLGAKVWFVVRSVVHLVRAIDGAALRDPWGWGF